MHQQKLDEIFKDQLNVFGIADNMLIVGHDANNRDHDRALRWVLQICQKENLKLNKNKCYFWCIQGQSWQDNIQNALPHKKDLKSFSDIMNCWGKFSPSTAEVCEPLRKLTSVKSVWTWNNILQNLYKREKSIIKNYTSIAFHRETEQLYLETETDALGVGIIASLLQVRDSMQFPKNEAPKILALWPISVQKHH